ASAPYLAALAQALQLDGATVSALHSAAGRAAP
ncbi:MAG: tellurite resistance TerB family protein, partial [Rhodobacteraceae bacterium]|nr:tellurite resistance TerB family protein [Paracoccaceae bacterium]